MYQILRHVLQRYTVPARITTTSFGPMEMAVGDAMCKPARSPWVRLDTRVGRPDALGPT